MTAQMNATGFAVDSTGIVTATGFVGPVTGNASTATSATTATTATTATDAAGALSTAPFYTSAAQVVDMAGATHALVLTTASTGQTKLISNTVFLDANGTGGGSSGQILKLPPVAGLPSGKTIRLRLINIGSETITLQTSAGGSTGIALTAAYVAEVEYVVASGEWAITFVSA